MDIRSPRGQNQERKDDNTHVDFLRPDGNIKRTKIIGLSDDQYRIYHTNMLLST